MDEIREVCVYCASSEFTPERYLRCARELGAAIAEAGATTLYGGGSVGMMGALADAALEAGGALVGVRPSFISELETPHPGASEMIHTETMHQRKQIFVDRADAFIALPGAIGTLDELIETITWRRLGLHNRAIVAVDVDGFFQPLRRQFERMVTDRLVAAPFMNLAAFVPDASSAMEYVRNYTAEPARPLLWPDQVL